LAQPRAQGMAALIGVGHNTMGAHLRPDACLWHPLPARHGSGGE
jgi:hypothetical protein